MSVYETNRTVPLGAISTLRVVSVFERAFDAFNAWRRARATASVLRDLSNAELADIGVNRGEIDEVAKRLSRA